MRKFGTQPALYSAVRTKSKIEIGNKVKTPSGWAGEVIDLYKDGTAQVMFGSGRISIFQIRFLKPITH